mmetsp:Transcript_119365/g.370914  ORF Transcript_119365/g.370914 Transcript_119365/m.370914 type:complete len:244 (+) Transcript_119365:951-1682(+)
MPQGLGQLLQAGSLRNERGDRAELANDDRERVERCLEGHDHLRDDTKLHLSPQPERRYQGDWHQNCRPTKTVSEAGESRAPPDPRPLLLPQEPVALHRRAALRGLAVAEAESLGLVVAARQGCAEGGLLRPDAFVKVHEGPAEDVHCRKGAEEGVAYHRPAEVHGDAADHAHEAQELQAVLEDVPDHQDGSVREVPGLHGDAHVRVRDLALAPQPIDCLRMEVLGEQAVRQGVAPSDPQPTSS